MIPTPPPRKKTKKLTTNEVAHSRNRTEGLLIYRKGNTSETLYHYCITILAWGLVYRVRVREDIQPSGR